MVPIEFSCAKAPAEVLQEVLMDKRETEVILNGVNENDWVKLNPGSAGFYRVQYSNEMLQMFKPAVSDLSLPPLDRLGLLGDLFALVRSLSGHIGRDYHTIGYFTSVFLQYLYP